MNNFYCYVSVTGEPSDSEDEDVPGVYEVEVQLPSPLDLAALSPTIDTAIAKAVLDEFHENFGIAYLGDFAIQVLLPNGTHINETDLVDDVEFLSFGVKATYHGGVEPTDLPFDFAGQADRPSESGVLKRQN